MSATAAVAIPRYLPIPPPDTERAKLESLFEDAAARQDRAERKRLAVEKWKQGPKGQQWLQKRQQQTGLYVTPDELALLRADRKLLKEWAKSNPRWKQWEVCLVDRCGRKCKTSVIFHLVKYHKYTPEQVLQYKQEHRYSPRDGLRSQNFREASTKSTLEYRKTEKGKAVHKASQEKFDADHPHYNRDMLRKYRKEHPKRFKKYNKDFYDKRTAAAERAKELEAQLALRSQRLPEELRTKPPLWQIIGAVLLLHDPGNPEVAAFLDALKIPCGKDGKTWASQANSGSFKERMRKVRDLVGKPGRIRGKPRPAE